MGHESPERAPEHQRAGHAPAVDARSVAAPAIENRTLDALTERAARATDPAASAAKLRPQAVQRLQLRAGNAAVAALLQRRAAPTVRRPAPAAPRAAIGAPATVARTPTSAPATALRTEGGVPSPSAAQEAPTVERSTNPSTIGVGLAGAPPPTDALPLQRSLASMIEEARRKAAPPSGPEDTKTVEGDTDLSEYTDAPAKAAEERKAIPPPPPPPLPATPGAVVSKAPPKPPPMPPKKRVGKALVAGPRPAKKAASAKKGAPAVGEIVKKPAPPLPPAYAKVTKAGATIPPPPAPPRPIKPQQDPSFAKVAKAAKMTVKQARKHPTGGAESAAAQAAAVAPGNDIDAQAKANRVDTMATAKPKPFDENAFVIAVEAEMRKSAPKNLDEADDVEQKSGGVKDAIGKKVAAGKDAAGGDVEAKAEQPPDPSTATPKPVTPMTPLELAQPGGMQASGAMPAPVPNEQVDFRHGPAKVDGEMAEAGVSEKQLAESNEPEFTGALDAKKEGEASAQAAPAQVRKAEAQILKQATVASAAEEKQAVGGAKGSMQTAMSQIAGKKDDTKSKDELKRKEVADHINSIFDKTRQDVDGILGGLETSVDEMFTAGEAAIRKSFTDDWKQRLDAYKDDRYSGLRGGYRWVRDKFKGLPAKANQLFDQSKAVYERDMQKLVRRIAQTVSAELNRATVRIEQGRGEVAAYVGSLKGDLAKFGQEAATDMAGKFDDLDSSVAEKFDDLAGSLAKRYSESQAAVAEEIEAAQAENRGLIDKAVDAVKGVVKVIGQLKDLILNVLTRIAGVVGDIIASPITFLKNFVTAVKGGITRFMDRIGEHLQKGLMGWLFGTLDAKGIEIPETFSLEGIMKLVMSVFGMTWEFVKERLAKKIGEPAVAALIAGADIVKKVVSGGPGVLWEMVVDKFTEFQDMVVGEIKNFVIEKVVKSGITFLISLMNPAAAFIKACKMIYDVVMFFVERGSQIKEFVDTLIDAAGDIATGGGGGIPEKIEGVLARLLPLAISFLANVIGLGGVGDKVRSIIDKVRNPIHKAMDKVIDVVVNMTAPIWKPAKRLFEKGKKLYGKAKDKVVKTYEAGKAKVKETYDAGKAKVKDLYGKGKKKVKDTATAAKDKVLSLFKPQKKPTTMSGAAHTLIAEPNKSGRFTISMKSEKELLSSKLTRTIAGLRQRMASEPPAAQAKTQKQIDELKRIGDIAAALEDLNPEGKRVTHMGAPEGFETEMRLLGDQVKGFGDKHGLKDIEPGTQVPLDALAKFGMPVPSYLQAQAIADQHNARIDIRATSAGAPELLAKGFVPKSEEFKQKTMGKDDELLGLDPSLRDRVVWFLPARPRSDEFEDPEQLRAVWARWRQRKDEYYANISKMKKKLREGQVAVRPASRASSGGMVEEKVDGVADVIKMVGITGDHDVYQVHGNARAVIAALEEAPFRVQHGAHLDWPSAVREAEKRDLTPTEQAIFAAIVRKHLPGGEPLLRINPNGPPTTASSSKLDFRIDGAGSTGGDDLDVLDVDLPAGEKKPPPAKNFAEAMKKFDALTAKHTKGVGRAELTREAKAAAAEVPSVHDVEVKADGDRWAFDVAVSRTVISGPPATGGGGGTAGAPKTLEELREALTGDARVAFDQQRDLQHPTNFRRMEAGFKDGAGNYDVAKAQAIFARKVLSADEVTAKKAKQSSDAIVAAQARITKIDNIVRQTTAAGRPGATRGDGSSEAAVEDEARTGTHHPASPSGHIGKCQLARDTLRTAVDELRDLKLRITDAATIAAIDAAIVKAQARILGLERAFPIWNTRISNYPAIWTGDGESKATPGWPPAAVRRTNWS